MNIKKDKKKTADCQKKKRENLRESTMRKLGKREEKDRERRGEKKQSEQKTITFRHRASTEAFPADRSMKR